MDRVRLEISKHENERRGGGNNTRKNVEEIA